MVAALCCQGLSSKVTCALFAPLPHRLHDAGMEAPAHAAAFVNFANAQFGYGKFIESCTQEEILQQCCPEFNVGMLFIGTGHVVPQGSAFLGTLD